MNNYGSSRSVHGCCQSNLMLFAVGIVLHRMHCPCARVSAFAPSDSQSVLWFGVAALSFIFSAGIAYLDLKSENCLIDQQAATQLRSFFVQPVSKLQGYLKMIDFGIARRITKTRYGPLKAPPVPGSSVPTGKSRRAAFQGPCCAVLFGELSIHWLDVES